MAEMCRLDLPVPPGLTITCQACMAYSNAGDEWDDATLEQIEIATRDREQRMGKRLGDDAVPLLVSVRAGAPFSMPGMMDTVLNLGLNDKSVRGLIEQTGDARFAWDSYRRFIQMFSDVVLGVDAELFENALVQRKLISGAASDAELSADDLPSSTSASTTSRYAASSSRRATPASHGTPTAGSSRCSPTWCWALTPSSPPMTSSPSSRSSRRSSPARSPRSTTRSSRWAAQSGSPRTRAFSSVLPSRRSSAAG